MALKRGFNRHGQSGKIGPSVGSRPSSARRSIDRHRPCRVRSIAARGGPPWCAVDITVVSVDVVESNPTESMAEVVVRGGSRIHRGGKHQSRTKGYSKDRVFTVSTEIKGHDMGGNKQL